MKKIIQIVSFLALVFVLAGVEVSAQQGTRIDANIPFDFAIGSDVYSAGKYSLNLRRMGNGAELVELRDKQGRFIADAFALQNGETGNGKSHLVFDQEASVARLSKIVIADRGFNVPLSEMQDGVTLAAKKKKAAESKN